MPIPAGGKVKIEYQYRIGFSAKSEIIGATAVTNGSQQTEVQRIELDTRPLRVTL